VEFPYIEQIHQKYKDQPFSVLAVESKGDRTGARDMIEENHYSFTILFDTEAVHRDNYRVFAFPTTYILDTDGNIIFRHIGFYPGMEIIMENEIRELLRLSPGQELSI
jgi:hypothetical protein